MDVEIIDTENPAFEYKITRKEFFGIKIAEIKESDSDCYDFVLMYYKITENCLSNLKILHDKYKINEKTICFIGSICDESFEPEKDYSEYFSYFDLNGNFMMEEEFENLILSCQACRGGITHGDPEDWLKLKKDENESLCCIYKTGKSVNEAFEKMYKTFLYVHLKYPDCKKIKNAIITVLANEVEVPIIERESIYKLIYFFDKEYSIILNVNLECSYIKPETVMITLI